jgi:hypothetical protein
MSSRFYRLPPTVQCPLCGSTVLELKPLQDAYRSVLVRCWNNGEEPAHYGCQYAAAQEEKIALALQTLAVTIDPALTANHAHLDAVVKDLLARVVLSVTSPKEKSHES